MVQSPNTEHGLENEVGQHAEIKVDAERIKGFTHPLRMQLLDALSNFGPQTASTLAERFGESSGATSYHLRQLAKFGFVEEATELGNKRERWWRRKKGAISFSPEAVKGSPSAELAMRGMVHQLTLNNQQKVLDFLDHGERVHGNDWAFMSTLSQTHIKLTLEQFGELSRRIHEFTTSLVEENRQREDSPDSKAVQLQVNLFPLIDPLHMNDHTL